MSIYATIELQASGHQELPPEFDPTGEGRVYGQALPYAAETLDVLARKVGVLPISTYLYDGGMLTDEERQQSGLPPAEDLWCDPHAGLRTVEGLIAALEEQNPTQHIGRMDVGRVDVGGVLWDLQVSRAILRRAVRDGERFRFYVC